MTASRSGRAPTRGQTARASSRARASRSSSQSSSGLLIGGGIAAAALIAVLVFALGGGASDAQQAGVPQEPSAATDPTPAATAAPSSEPLVVTGAGRAGSVPDRPAPAIDQAVIDEARGHYDAAVQLWNEGQRARQSGASDVYVKRTKEAFDELQKQRELMRPYTDWYEEADLEGWAAPAEYSVGLQRLLDQWDPLYQRVKKLKQVD